VDWDTFTRFAEFIYGGDYNTAQACVVLDEARVEIPRAESDSPKAEAAYPFDRPTQTENPFHKAQKADAEPEWPSGWTSEKHTRAFLLLIAADVVVAVQVALIGVSAL